MTVRKAIPNRGRYSSVADILLHKPFRPAGLGGSHQHHHHHAHAARRTFDAHDHGRSGCLGVTELLRVAEDPQRILSSELREVSGHLALACRMRSAFSPP